MSKKYYCDCPRYCKVRRRVAVATYRRHAKHRDPDANITPAFSQFLQSHGAGSSSSTPLTSENSIFVSGSGSGRVSRGEKRPTDDDRLAGQADSSRRRWDDEEQDEPERYEQGLDAGNTPSGGGGTEESGSSGEGLGNTTPEGDGAPTPEGNGAPTPEGDGAPIAHTAETASALRNPLAASHSNSVPSGQSESSLSDPGSSQSLRSAPQDATRNPSSGGIFDNNGSENFGDQAEGFRTEEIILGQQFIQLLRVASLDDESETLDPDVLERLRSPLQGPPNLDDPHLRLSIDLFLATNNASRQTYIDSRNAFLRCHPEDPVLTYDQVKRQVAELSGVVSIKRDMCPNTCLAYTGPFADLESCPTCSEPRYDSIKLAESGGKTKIPRQQFSTIPLGPQLQALRRTVEGAESFKYLDLCTKKIMEELQHNDGYIGQYEDFCYGSDYLTAVAEGRIDPSQDSVLLISIDGAQLYRSKLSDCWIYIWVILNLSPDKRYKKAHVLPGGFISGPNKPKNVDSFLFPGFHHVAALQREGLKVWDASRNAVVPDHPFVALGTADGPGMIYFDGLVGHQGACGCRRYCGMKGRRKPGGNHYYPVRMKPDNFHVEGCDHDDVDISTLPTDAAARYWPNLAYVLASQNNADFLKRRLETGISKPSIFSGFVPHRILGVPGCFGSDLMHLGSINIPDLLLGLWRATLDCDRRLGDSKDTWDWAVLQGDTWKAHGKAVAAVTPYLPGSFDRPPRNPAEKISSGYKAWEFLIYLFCLGPGLFHGLLPEKYYKNFCKLVRGMRLIHQRSISAEQLQIAHQSFLEFSIEFELLYCQRKASRIHFVRPSIHALSHLGPEAARIGPGPYGSQWTMERTIGNLGEEIKQPSNLYANLAERGLRRSQINALKVMIPDLETEENLLPRGAIDLGGGYVLLRAMDDAARSVRAAEDQAVKLYLDHTDTPYADGRLHVVRWARLRLPNGQVARSAWKETLKPLDRVRMARNVKLQIHGALRFGEVQFYMCLPVACGNRSTNTRTVALISLYSTPDTGLLAQSFNTLYSCQHQGDTALVVVDVQSIVSVVAMVPHRPVLQSGRVEDRYFVAEKPGLDVAYLDGTHEEFPADDA
ncbi:hypothetical protein PLICRDRAFT_32845 [Plicaturopsis crispa FD-325 SS-3]|uniref:Unplaced genomic scaffold PLICRscaffold_22, whole genome shotgun sequence n=1 Tax=Plicaturopsis crispa FD-325 SS-3 TaxID=944288 RepID=A0A0C9SWE7_PLICR|nr:hypothetical protein PLICRDRAFT_32845 [Plicaturopsis crispa FD-325 SS-3]